MAPPMSTRSFLHIAALASLYGPLLLEGTSNGGESIPTLGSVAWDAGGTQPLAAAFVTNSALAEATARAKLCIYGIALNERRHVDGFMAASQGADLVAFADAGSNDGTPEVLEAAGAVVHRIALRPFRFDTARNIALSLLPVDCDLCLALDLADALQPGWAEALRAEWRRTGGTLTEARVAHVWKLPADGGTSAAQVFAPRVHSRFGYTWDGPAHEALCRAAQAGGVGTRDMPPVVPGLVIHNRVQAGCQGSCRLPFLHLLKLGVDERPDDPRRAYLYGRELQRMLWLDAAITELDRYLGLPAATNPEQRASALRHISECQLALKRPHEARSAALRALAEYSSARSGSSQGAGRADEAAGSCTQAAFGAGEHLRPWELWLALARASHWMEDWPAVYWAATQVLAAANHSAPQPSGTESLGAELHDMAALSAYYLGFHKVAAVQGEAALALSPHDERLQANLRFYRQAAPGAGHSGSSQPGNATLSRS